MTAKEMRNFLRNVPDETELIFQLWNVGGFTNYEIHKSSGMTLVNAETNKITISIGHADNCKAHKVKIK